MAHLHDPPRAILYTRQRLTRGPTGASYVTVPGVQELRSAWATRHVMRSPLSRALYGVFARREKLPWVSLASRTLSLPGHLIKWWMDNPLHAPAYALRKFLGAAPLFDRWLEEERAIRHMEVDAYFSRVQRELAIARDYTASVLQTRAERATERAGGQRMLRQKRGPG